MPQRQEQSIEAEVDQYLSDPPEEHLSLDFWQVCHIYSNTFHVDSSLYRE
jgi:hypothetical protein